MAAGRVIDSLVNRILDLERFVHSGYDETNDLVEKAKERKY